MFGDVLYVERKRIWFNSYKPRRNLKSGKLDVFVARFVNYKHYGIEVEDGHVIHFHGDSISGRRHSLIKRVTLEEFQRDAKEVHIERNVDYQFSRIEVVNRCYSVLGTNFDTYSLRKNNCEHFVYWCTTGEKSASQYKQLEQGLGVMSYPKKLVPVTYKAKDFTVRLVKSGFNIYK